jgi:hypothetical protein
MGNRPHGDQRRLRNRVSAFAWWTVGLPPLLFSVASKQVNMGIVTAGSIIRTISAGPWSRVNMHYRRAGAGLRLNG